MNNSSKGSYTIRVQEDFARMAQLFNDLDKLVVEQRENANTSKSAVLNDASRSLSRILLPGRRILDTLERQLKDHEEERVQLRALQAVGAALNSSLNPADVLNVVMDTMIRITGAERGFLMLMDEDTGEVTVQAARNIKEESIEDPSQISTSVINEVMDNGQPLLTTNAQDDPRFANRQSIISYNLRSILCVPLNLKDDTIGVIYVDNRITAGIFREPHRDQMAAFANQAAVAIENARLFRQIRMQLSEITEMKTLMDDVFASMGSGVITIDNADEVSLYNPAAGRILGIPGSYVESRFYKDVFDEVDPALGKSIEELVSKVKDGGRLQTAELDITTPESDQGVTISLNLSPLRDVQQKMLGVAMVVDDISEKKRMESVRKYLPPSLVDRVRDLDAAQRPQRRSMTVMFADVTGYSTFSENLEPEHLVEIINEYFTVAANAINDQFGVIDKFMGDAVMALFNTQLNPQDDHSERAVRTALNMQAALDGYLKTVPANRHLHFSIGIHTGEAVAGNVGSSFRKDFTVIGDAVNLAKRLEENADSKEIVISQSVYDGVRDLVEVEPREPMKVKGRNAMEKTYLLKGFKNHSATEPL
ncbi:MAG: adenylate/guanylate cyclase domain-containing protein [Anaerolineae bacterium]